MTDSLKSKIKSLCYKGEITEKERDRIIKALEQTELNPSYNGVKSELEPYEDCISRAEAQEEITKAIELKENPYQMYKRIQSVPSVTPQQRVGKWMEYPNGYVCSECGIIRAKGRTGKYNYCPNCGAKMGVV